MSRKPQVQLHVGQLVVPYMVDATRTPIDFRELDEEHVDNCARHARCGVCGKKIRRSPWAFIGPRISHGRECFADPWMHVQCALLAMKQCPFLRGDKDWREQQSRTDPLLKPYSEGMLMSLAPGGHAHKDQVHHWHFEAVGGLTVIQLNKPNTPAAAALLSEALK